MQAVQPMKQHKQQNRLAPVYFSVYDLTGMNSMNTKNESSLQSLSCQKRKQNVLVKEQNKDYPKGNIVYLAADKEKFRPTVSLPCSSHLTSKYTDP